MTPLLRVGLAAFAAMAGGAAEAQTCNYIAKAPAAEALRHVPEGAVIQAYCAPCRDRRARKIVVEDSELRALDTYFMQLVVNGTWVDPAYLYVADPRRPRRWTNLGLLVKCHEEDDVPPTLPGDKVAE